jgi:DNA-binding transcriptional ArsR family regulator
MSPRTPKAAAKQKQTPHARSQPVEQAPTLRHGPPRPAATLAALADPTRLSLLTKLSRSQPSSISQLTHGSRLTRQAITKHLRVLERAKIVRCVRSGRHALFELDSHPVLELRDYLDRISAQWDEALFRLKSFVEDEP